MATYRLLVVDDSAALLSIIGAYLKGSAYDVVATARDGEAGVERFRRFRPDAVLLDVVMPGGGGTEALKAIRTEDPAAVVGMMSSFGTEDVVAECRRAGAGGFLHKPFSRDDLLAFLGTLLGS